MAAAAKIPVIDISAEGADQVQVAKELVEAAVEHGFIYIKNLGRDIPVDLVDNMFDMTRTLFLKTPLEEKQRCKIQTNNRGWSGMQVETLDPKNQRVGDYKEAFNFGEFTDGTTPYPIPSTIQEKQATIATFTDACYELCLKLNALLGIGLEVTPPTFFTDSHRREKGPSGTTLRVLYYPPFTSTDADREDVRAGAHSDYGSVTMLFRLKGQAGLEVLTQEGSWAPVPVSPPGTEDDPSPPILVNIGDVLSYWTNGLLRSTVHRVVFPGPGKVAVPGESDSDPRFSMVCFCHPAGSTELTPVPSERVKNYVPGGKAQQGNPYSEREVMTASEHLQMRLRRSYLTVYDQKEEGTKAA